MKLRSTSKSTGYGVIAVVGGAIMDLVYETERMPRLDESVDALSLAYKPGGKGSNTAIAIYRGQRNKPTPPTGPAGSVASPAKQGSSSSGAGVKKQEDVRVYLNTAVGNDHFGKELMRSLQQNGVDTSGIETLEGSQTGTCSVFVERFSRNGRDIGFPGANTDWQPGYKDSVECLAGGNKPDLIVVHLENDRKVVESILATANRHGVDTILNPSPVYALLEPTYKTVTHLLLNEVEVEDLADVPKELATEEAMLKACEHFMERGVKHVVITLGERGAYYATAGAHGLVEAVDVDEEDMKDSTGAGDTFVGTYALECVQQKRGRSPWDIRKAVEKGCKAAAKTLQQLGAQDAIPWADEV
ncbi:hypothetical protein B0A55_05980 [Friedmanniomyces simplex]|uniref:Carbohydrate kinase PfkB domain-containing protein n=1 Tax=Friedmanniomyces simplex TaxID=329884 RepID=A0A4U0XDL2_9PEZI|nr:hypothetical protein B0A55_05980 [Friedmanniomyces simplex]